MNSKNIILRTDSYKLTHHNQYPEGTQGVYSYLEAREGAEHPATVFFGLQAILKTLAGRQVTAANIQQADELAGVHFGNRDLFNAERWTRIAKKHDGRLPVRIKAVPEGTVVPVGNVLMTVENTDPEAYWLTNALESVLMHVWYPTTVATLSRGVKQNIQRYLKRTADDAALAGLLFMLHDFGYRGVSSDESAEMGGMGHLVNFMGTDTLLAMVRAVNDYDAKLESLAFSVPATEHSVMTARGRAGEMEIVADLLDKHPTGILSVVADSFNIYAFVDTLGTTFKGRVLARDGKFVMRPDSITKADKTPAELVVKLLDKLYTAFGGSTNAKGFKVLDPHVGLLWGDGLDPVGINDVMHAAMEAGYSAENLVFGMGGGLLQKVNRDTERFAFKASAMGYDGTWHDVQKQPLDTTKASKKGRLKLVAADPHGFATVRENDIKFQGHTDYLQTVFEDGELVNPTTFDAIRERAAL